MLVANTGYGSLQLTLRNTIVVLADNAGIKMREHGIRVLRLLVSPIRLRDEPKAFAIAYKSPSCSIPVKGDDKLAILSHPVIVKAYGIVRASLASQRQ